MTSTIENLDCIKDIIKYYDPSLSLEENLKKNVSFSTSDSYGEAYVISEQYSDSSYCSSQSKLASDPIRSIIVLKSYLNSPEYASLIKPELIEKYNNLIDTYLKIANELVLKTDINSITILHQKHYIVINSLINLFMQVYYSQCKDESYKYHLQVSSELNIISFKLLYLQENFKNIFETFKKLNGIFEYILCDSVSYENKDKYTPEFITSKLKEFYINDPINLLDDFNKYRKYTFNLLCRYIKLMHKYQVSMISNDIYNNSNKIIGHLYSKYKKDFTPYYSIFGCNGRILFYESSAKYYFDKINDVYTVPKNYNLVQKTFKMAHDGETFETIKQFIIDNKDKFMKPKRETIPFKYGEIIKLDDTLILDWFFDILHLMDNLSTTLSIKNNYIYMYYFIILKGINYINELNKNTEYFSGLYIKYNNHVNNQTYDRYGVLIDNPLETTLYNVNDYGNCMIIGFDDKTLNKINCKYMKELKYYDLSYSFTEDDTEYDEEYYKNIFDKEYLDTYLVFHWSY